MVSPETANKIIWVASDYENKHKISFISWHTKQCPHASSWHNTLTKISGWYLCKACHFEAIYWFANIFSYSIVLHSTHVNCHSSSRFLFGSWNLVLVLTSTTSMLRPFRLYVARMQRKFYKCLILINKAIADSWRVNSPCFVNNTARGYLLYLKLHSWPKISCTKCKICAEIYKALIRRLVLVH